jgi:hypothetical protein
MDRLVSRPNAVEMTSDCDDEDDNDNDNAVEMTGNGDGDDEDADEKPAVGMTCLLLQGFHVGFSVLRKN